MAADADVGLSLGELAYQQLRDEIVTCRLQPGQRLAERRLAASTGFGVSPIREALKRLDHEGLIITVPRSGYQVAPLTIRVVDELFDFWAFIGPEVGRRGVQHATPEQRHEIVTGLAALVDALDHVPWGPDAAIEFTKLATRVFHVLAQAAGNSYLTSVYDRLAHELARVYVLILSSDSEAASKLKGDIPSAFDSGDGDVLAAEMRRFIRRSHDEVLRILARWPSVMASEVTPLKIR